MDGLRVDLTQAIHRDNTRHADGQAVGHANLFGQKLLREWSRTLHMIRPATMLIAEDHTGWDAVTKLPAQGGHHRLPRRAAGVAVVVSFREINRRREQRRYSRRAEMRITSSTGWLPSSGTAAMASTTDIPSTTRAKTVNPPF